VRGASEVKNLQLNFALGRPNYLAPVWRGEKLLSEGEFSGGSGMAEAEINAPKVLPFDLMQVELIHRDVPLMISSTVIQAPLENTVEPLLCTLGAFCAFDDFKKMLFEPQHFAKPPEKIFENAVTWLLSLAGFHTINLAPAKGQQAFDVLRAPETGFEIGSADVIAYEENKRLLLVDCDIGSIDDRKIERLVEVKRYLEKKSKATGISFVPVLCTPRGRPNRTTDGVILIDRSIIESMLEDIAKGNRQAARDRIFGILLT
jgi:hypothetical protein